MGCCCSSNKVELYQQTLLFRQRHWFDMNKTLIPYDKIVSIKKSHSYTFWDFFFILITFGCYYFFFIKSGLVISLSNGDVEFSGSMRKKYASEKFREIASRVFTKEDPAQWKDMDKEEEEVLPQSPSRPTAAPQQMPMQEYNAYQQQYLQQQQMAMNPYMQQQTTPPQQQQQMYYMPPQQQQAPPAALAGYVPPQQGTPMQQMQNAPPNAQ
jgi:hypothetical protein